MDPLSYRIEIYCVLKEYTKFSYVKKKKSVFFSNTQV